jgi:hypothetical protein
MSSTASISEQIKKKIHDTVLPVFADLGISIAQEDIWNDLASYASNQVVATFYIKGLDNVERKPFNEKVANQKLVNKEIVELKVKFKRPEKEVRFYLKTSKIENTNQEENQHEEN